MDDPQNHNALSGALTVQLQRELALLCADARLKSIVLTGSGEFFSVGGDWQMMQERAHTYAAARRGHHRAVALDPPPVRRHRAPDHRHGEDRDRGDQRACGRRGAGLGAQLRPDLRRRGGAPGHRLRAHRPGAGDRHQLGAGAAPRPRARHGAGAARRRDQRTRGRPDWAWSTPRCRAPSCSRTRSAGASASPGCRSTCRR